MDIISDMLISIKNAQAVKRASVKSPYSKVNFAIAEILKSEGIIQDVTLKKRDEKSWIIIGLSYEGEGNVEGAVRRGLKRISKPGKRMYVGYKKFSSARRGGGIMILSTPKGIMKDTEARKLKVGGEILCEIYQ